MEGGSVTELRDNEWTISRTGQKLFVIDSNDRPYSLLVSLQIITQLELCPDFGSSVAFDITRISSRNINMVRISLVP